MSNEELALLIQQGTDTVNNLDMLYKQNRGLIYSIAKKYSHYAEIEDLMQESFLALCGAAKKYDPEQGAFSTYFTYWLRQYMQRYVDNSSSCCRIPVHQRTLINKYKRFITSYMAERNTRPTEDEVCCYLDIGSGQYEQLRKDLLMSDMKSLDATVKGMEDDLTVGETVADDYNLENDVLDRMQQEHLKHELWDCVDSLEWQQAAVIRDRYQDNLTLSDTGERRGVNAEAARQLEQKALKELRKPSRAKRIRPFLEEYLRVAAYRHAGVKSFSQTWTSATERVALRLMELEESSDC